MKQCVSRVLAVVGLYGLALGYGGDAFAEGYNVNNFDFVAPVVKDDTIPPKQAGSIFFNAGAGEFQGFDLSGNTMNLSGGVGSSGPYGQWQFDASDCNWTRASSSYGDFSNDSTCTFSQQANHGMGTVSAISGVQPGITFAAPKTGTIKICAEFQANGGSDYWAIRLVEAAGPTVINKTGGVTSSSPSTQDATKICGFYDVTATSTYNFKMQGLIRTPGAVTIGNGVGSDSNALVFSVEYK